jgi:hypothetical protein
MGGKQGKRKKGEGKELGHEQRLKKWRPVLASYNYYLLVLGSKVSLFHSHHARQGVFLQGIS